jgi:hypothetical protein
MKTVTFQLRSNNSVCAGAFQLLRGCAPAQLRRYIDSDACKSCILHRERIKGEDCVLIRNKSSNARVVFSFLTTVSNQSDASEIRRSFMVFLSYFLVFFFLSRLA